LVKCHSCESRACPALDAGNPEYSAEVILMTDKPNLGPCCGCGKQDDTVRNIILLNLKGTVPDQGWGCVICGIWGGAVAVLCNDCVEQGFEIKFACDGYPKDGNRIPIEELTEPFDHDLRLHPGLENHWSREIGHA
jgi:hypothetical protein